jgi:hypothetical protein
MKKRTLLLVSIVFLFSLTALAQGGVDRPDRSKEKETQSKEKETPAKDKEKTTQDKDLWDLETFTDRNGVKHESGAASVETGVGDGQTWEFGGPEPVQPGEHREHPSSNNERSYRSGRSAVVSGATSTGSPRPGLWGNAPIVPAVIEPPKVIVPSRVLDPDELDDFDKLVPGEYLERSVRRRERRDVPSGSPPVRSGSSGTGLRRGYKPLFNSNIPFTPSPGRGNLDALKDAYHVEIRKDRVVCETCTNEAEAIQRYKEYLLNQMARTGTVTIIKSVATALKFGSPVGLVVEVVSRLMVPKRTADPSQDEIHFEGPQLPPNMRPTSNPFRPAMSTPPSSAPRVNSARQPRGSAAGFGRTTVVVRRGVMPPRGSRYVGSYTVTAPNGAEIIFDRYER